MPVKKICWVPLQGVQQETSCETSGAAVALPKELKILLHDMTHTGYKELANNLRILPIFLLATMAQNVTTNNTETLEEWLLQKGSQSSHRPPGGILKLPECTLSLR